MTPLARIACSRVDLPPLGLRVVGNNDRRRGWWPEVSYNPNFGVIFTRSLWGSVNKVQVRPWIERSVAKVCGHSQVNYIGHLTGRPRDHTVGPMPRRRGVVEPPAGPASRYPGPGVRNGVTLTLACPHDTAKSGSDTCGIVVKIRISISLTCKLKGVHLSEERYR